MKNQLKKSFSLIMTVLMLMTCWVWVAPDKAEAYLNVSYSATIVYDVDNTAENGGHAIIYYYPFNDDGTLNISSMIEYTPTNNTWGSLFHEADGTTGVEVTLEGIPGWPCKIFWQVNGKGANNYNVRITKLKINTVTVATYTGAYLKDDTAWNKWDQTRNFIWQWDGNGASDSMISSRNWSKPTFTTLTSIEVDEAGTLGKLPNGAAITTQGRITGGKDQYGVALPSNYFPTSGVDYTLEYSNASGTRVGLGSDYATASGNGNTATVTLKSALQKLFEDRNGGTIFLVAKYGNSTADANIRFSNPVYQATFMANGGEIGISADGSNVSATGEVKVPESLDGAKTYYGAKIGKQPAYAKRAGYEFMGFYSNAVTAMGKDFTPSGTKFEDNVTKVGASGDSTWYAAWQASPINATFVTQDGQLIGTVEGRYNNYLTASDMYNGDAGLNAAVKAAYTGSTVTFNTNNEPIYTDGSTSYTFAGWKIIKAYDESVVDGNEDTVLQGDVTFQAVYTKADAATYTVKFKNAEGTVISEKSGYKYRDDVTNIPAEDPTKAQDDVNSYEFIGWAKDIGKNFYTVDENDCDENGAKIVYTHKDGAEFIVKGDASYVPVFRMVPREYKVTYNYTADNNTPASAVIEGYHWHDGVKMPEIKDNYTADGFRYYIDGWQVNGASEVKQLNEIAVNGDMSLTAVYGNREAAKYTINFYGKDVDGETDVLLNGENNIYEHNSEVTAPEVPLTIDTDNALYTFAGWSPSVEAKAAGDADYYATYTKKVYADLHFYNYDGTLIYETAGKENSLFVGETIPAYTGETPVKPEDAVGTYKFTGWADSQGNPVVPGTDEFAGDTYLTAQFETAYKEYTVKFVNEEETVSERKYHYGDPVVIPENPTKEADVEYIYDFRAWTPDVSEVCYDDATYEATYRRTPKYYTVTWLNDAKAVHTAGNYQYNAKIQQAVINSPVSYDAPATGKTWAFKHWVQCDENGDDITVDGKQVIFTRGQRMGAEHLYFYPVFEEVDNVLTVTFYKEDGTTLLGEAKIPYGGTLADYAEPFAAKAPKISDDTYHYIINKWVNVNGEADVTTINADVSVKPVYTAEEHNKQIYEVVAEPTCNVPGYGHLRCVDEDGRIVDECTEIDYNVPIAPIADEGAPTGQVYVGENKWTLENYKAGIKYEDIKYVGPNTNVIVNAEDTGTRSMPWNVEGSKSRGVGKIEYYVANGKIADTSTITNWTEVYNYEQWRQEALEVVLKENKITLVDYNGYIRGDVEQQMKKAEIDRAVDALLSVYNANATGVLSNLNLVNGKTYVIYIKVSDREGNGVVNSCIFSSGTISYGSTAAEITVSGEGYGTKFCAEATISIADDTDGYKLYIDGVEAALTDGKYVCADKGVHTATVVDKHGNKTTKTFEIKGSHEYRNYTTAATCENDGSRYDLCTVCGNKANVTDIPAFGHSYTVNYIDKAPDCINNGYRTYVCDNNCGTKLVLKPTDDAAKLAQAKVYAEPADGEDEGEWVALKADDLKHLKATGKHTYAMVKDENGEDTAEYVWVIDKEATCSVEGSKHRDCTVCGIAVARVTEEIPRDTENGHKFYREKVTLEPTCTTEGERTKTCRYCGEKVVVENLPALGHTAGEYKIIKDATCEEAGSKILTCSVCGVEIGEAGEDDEGNAIFTGEAVVIPALDHAWKLEGVPFKGDKLDEEGQVVTDENGEAIQVWYQKYVCANDATHTKNEVLEDYVEPVKATVTFKNGEDDFKVIEGYVSDVITAAQVADKPTKAADVNYKYTFSHWADKDGKEVKFPVTVTGDATYTAVYAEKYVNYTITYYKEDGTTEFKKVGYLHNGDDVALVAGPAKAGNWKYTYSFAGWAMDVDKLDAEGNPVLDTNGNAVKERKVIDAETVKINGANINLFATYDKVLNKYAVTYAYSRDNILETFAVDAGTTARDCAIVPVKAADSKYHYEFKAWNRAEQLVSVESNIYTTPDFESELHSYDHAGGKVLKTPATCTSNAVYTYTCACGYTYSKEEANTALGHLWSEPVYDEETGKNVVTCQRGCGTSQEDTRTFTVKFIAEGQAYKTVSYIPWGTTIDATKLPGTPSKAATATYEYKFKGWALKDDATNAIVDIAKLVVKQDYEFVAVFEAVVREYTVIFAYDAYNVIETHKNVKAGSSVSFGGATPTKAPDVNYHYSFKGWSGSTANVQGDVYVTAVFDKTEHTYTSFELNEATCKNGKGTRYYCDCNNNGKFDDKVNGAYVDYFYDVTGKPLAHDFKEIERKEATEKADGYIKYECKNCGETKTETLKYVDNVISIQVTVTVNGAVKSGVQVEILEKSASATPIFVTTNANGIANAKGVKGIAYACFVTIDGNKHEVTLTADANGNLTGSYSHSESVNCSCACHRDNFWGAIFRFFHKIIKLVTGEFKCCGNPDPMYG